MGLAYIGLPLAVEFGKAFDTIGFDISATKIASYRQLVDPTGEVSTADLKAATLLNCTTHASDLARADIVIIAVPTPVTEARLPDFSPLLSACAAIGPHLKFGAIVVFESTVYRARPSRFASRNWSGSPASNGKKISLSVIHLSGSIPATRSARSARS